MGTSCWFIELSHAQLVRTTCVRNVLVMESFVCAVLCNLILLSGAHGDCFQTYVWKAFVPSMKKLHIVDQELPRQVWTYNFLLYSAIYFFLSNAIFPSLIWLLQCRLSLYSLMLLLRRMHGKI